MGGTVVVAMSGGVDSSVAAALLKEQGYHVLGVTLNIWPAEGSSNNGRVDRSCCSLAAVEDARRVARRLGISHYVLNFRDIFSRAVVDDFVEEYRRGRTPNPCIRCNRFVKFEALLHRAVAWGADWLATGHYARIDFDPAAQRWRLKKAVDLAKDQSYFLYMLAQAQLSMILMPLGGFAKAETRGLAGRLGLSVASKPESQEICFVDGRNYGSFLRPRDPELQREGPIVDRHGRVIGRHPGIAFFTRGQRHGLGLALVRPVYVCGILPEANTLVVGPEEELLSRECRATRVNWVAGGPGDGPREAMARIRYRAPECGATLYPEGVDEVLVRFHEPQRAVAPGQAVVFYDGDDVLGGGVIAE